MVELEHALRPAEALQLVLAEVAEAAAVREAVGDQRGCGCRQEHLAAVAGGHDPRRAIEGRAEVVPLTRGGLAGVQAHADAERPGGAPGLLCEPALGVQAGAQAVDRRVEDGHESVADRLHDVPA
jgi:hypothetical protein